MSMEQEMGATNLGHEEEIDLKNLSAEEIQGRIDEATQEMDDLRAESRELQGKHEAKELDQAGVKRLEEVNNRAWSILPHWVEDLQKELARRSEETQSPGV